MSVSNIVIGRNVKKIRSKIGITQAQAAELLGISTLHYGRLERGTRSASLAELDHIAESFNTSIESILSGSTSHLYSATRENIHDVGLIITFLAEGCTSAARSLMIEACQTIAKYDKNGIL